MCFSARAFSVSQSLFLCFRQSPLYPFKFTGSGTSLLKAIFCLIWFITQRRGWPLSVVDFRLDRLWLAVLRFFRSHLFLLTSSSGRGCLRVLGIHSWMWRSSLSIRRVSLFSSFSACSALNSAFPSDPSSVRIIALSPGLPLSFA